MSDTASMFKQLYNCLSSQEAILDRLAGLGQAQLDALRQNNPGELARLVAEQEACAADMEQAEAQRVSLLDEMSSRLSLEKGVTLSKLLPFATGPVRLHLQQLLGILQEKVRVVQELNTINSALIKRSQQVNDRLLKVLSSGTVATYGQKGEVRADRAQVSVLNHSV